MFIQDDDLIDIKVYHRRLKHRYNALTEKEYEALVEEEKKKYSVLSVSMKEMTWGLFNQLQDEALVENASGEQKFNYRIYKENRLKKLIKSWDAKDKNGKSIPVSENTISHLAPTIAEVILKSYDEVSFLDEEEEGK